MESAAGNSPVYYRLITLWIVCEAMLGGIIHGLKLPVSGLLVGGSSVIIICLMAHYVPQRGAILKATVLVAIFKMMLSPHSPPAAYFAVFFQGLLGELIFLRRKNYSISCIAFGSLALFESGVQRILVMTILYGTDFWQAVNDFIAHITNRPSAYSQYLAGGYVVLHILVGAWIGWLAQSIPGRMQNWKKETKWQSPGNDVTVTSPESSLKQKRKWKAGFLMIWIALFIVFLQSEFHIGEPILSPGRVADILLRSVLIVLTWQLIVAPILMKYIRRWLEKKKQASQDTVSELAQLLPEMQMLVKKSWSEASSYYGLARFRIFFKRVLTYALREEGTIYILSGATGSGKTTLLQKWATGRNVSGILTPVVDGKRFFMDLKTKELFPMEAGEGEADVLKVGRYVFSAAAFQRAKQILVDASKEKTGYIVVDEIGPLELEGGGFCDEVRSLLSIRNGELQIVLVIRESLLGKAISYLGLDIAPWQHFEFVPAIPKKIVGVSENPGVPE